MQKKDRFGIRKMVLIALFTAFAYAVTFAFRINVSFLTFDAKDAVMIEREWGGFYFVSQILLIVRELIGKL